MMFQVIGDFELIFREVSPLGVLDLLLDVVVGFFFFEKPLILLRNFFTGDLFLELCCWLLTELCPAFRLVTLQFICEVDRSCFKVFSLLFNFCFREWKELWLFNEETRDWNPLAEILE